MLEFLNKMSWNRIETEKSFVPTEKILRYIVSDLISSSEYNKELDDRLIELSHQKPSAVLDYEIIAPSKTEGQFDICVNDNGRITPIFTIGFGENSIFYVNKFTQTDKMIYKAKLLTDFKSREELLDTVRDFVMTPPTENEIIDISREALEKKMNERKLVEPVSFINFKK